MERVGEEDDRRSNRRKFTKEEKKQRSGANKGRRFGKVRDDLELCWKVAVGKTCEYGEQYVHTQCFRYLLLTTEEGAATPMTSKPTLSRSRKI